MNNEILGWIMFALSSVGVFVIIWLLARILSTFSDRILPQEKED